MRLNSNVTASGVKIDSTDAAGRAESLVKQNRAASTFCVEVGSLKFDEVWVFGSAGASRNGQVFARADRPQEECVPCEYLFLARCVIAHLSALPNAEACCTCHNYVLASPLTCAAAKAQAPYQKIHFKNAVEVVHAVRGMKLERAKTYLGHVLEETEAIPFQRFKGGRGRHAQAKNLKVPGSLVGWPKSAVKSVLSMIKNAEANAESKGLALGECQLASAWRSCEDYSAVGLD